MTFPNRLALKNISKLSHLIYSFRDSIKIPLSKADKDLSAIRNKLLHKKPTLNPENVPAPA